MKHRSYDTVIVGGGIIGLFTAWELSKAGQSVCVIERGAMGQEASWAAGGILSPLRPWKYPKAVNALALWSHKRYSAICAELQVHTGIDCQWRQGGMLLLDCPDNGLAQQWADVHDITLEWLSAKQVTGEYPALALGGMNAAKPACRLPHVAQLRNPRLLQALIARLDQLGVRLCDATEMQSLIVEAGIAKGVKTTKGDYAVEQVVIAAGAWSSALLPGVGRYNNIRPVKGQMLLYGPGSWEQATVVMSGDRYLVPRADGRLIVGSTVEEAGYDQSTDTNTQTSLRAFAESLLPSLVGSEPEGSWAGLRPATQDEVPVIGAHAEVQGLYINTGHYRSGIIMAPAAAMLLTDILCERAPSIDPSDYLPT